MSPLDKLAKNYNKMLHTIFAAKQGFSIPASFHKYTSEQESVNFIEYSLKDTGLGNLEFEIFRENCFIWSIHYDSNNDLLMGSASNIVHKRTSREIIPNKTTQTRIFMIPNAMGSVADVDKPVQELTFTHFPQYREDYVDANNGPVAFTKFAIVNIRHFFNHPNFTMPDMLKLIPNKMHDAMSLDDLIELMHDRCERRYESLIGKADNKSGQIIFVYQSMPYPDISVLPYTMGKKLLNQTQLENKDNEVVTDGKEKEEAEA